MLTRLFRHRRPQTKYEQCWAIYHSLVRLGQNNSTTQLHLESAKDALFLATIMLGDDDNKGLTQMTQMTQMTKDKEETAYGNKIAGKVFDIIDGTGLWPLNAELTKHFTTRDATEVYADDFTDDDEHHRTGAVEVQV